MNCILLKNYDLVVFQLILLLFATVNIVLKNKTNIIRPSKIIESNAFVIKIPVNKKMYFFRNNIKLIIVTICFRMSVN